MTKQQGDAVQKQADASPGHVATMLLAVIALALLAGPGPSGAFAAEREPQVKDPCGPVEGVNDPERSVEPHLPWQDICTGRIASVATGAGDRGVRLTATFAGAVVPRPPTAYSFEWHGGDCAYDVQLHDAAMDRLGEAESARRYLDVRCGRREEPCGPGGVLVCVSWTHQRSHRLPPGAFTESGDVITVTLVSTGPLSRYASDFQAGTTLSDLLVRAHPGPGRWTASTVCLGDFVRPRGCSSLGGDLTAKGEPYVVPDDPEASVPAPHAVACADSLVPDASLRQPHLVDADDDAPAARAQAQTSRAADIWAAWIGVGQDGNQVRAHIFPAGPAASERIRYALVYGDRRWVDARRRADGSFAFTYGRNERSAGAYRAVVLGETTGSVNATTGEVVIDIPAGTLPSRAGAPVDVRFASASTAVVLDEQSGWIDVDTTRAQDVCRAFLPPPDGAPWMPRLRHEVVYFNCHGQASGNAAAVAGESPSWSTAKPQRSLAEGGGCVTMDVPNVSSTTHPEEVDVVWSGEYEGNLDAFTLRLYVRASQVLSDDLEFWPLRLSLNIDGREVPLPAVTTQPIPTGGLLDYIEVSVADLGLVARADDRPHALRVAMAMDMEVSAWVFGATDAPAGLEFHPEELAAEVLRPR